MEGEILETASRAHLERGGYLFSDVGLGSPLEELQAIFEKKLRTFQNLGEGEKGRVYTEAYELARKRLSASLGVEPEEGRAG